MHRTAILFAIFLAGFARPAGAAFDPQTSLQLVDYVAVDYPEAVSDGAVVNAQPVPGGSSS